MGATEITLVCSFLKGKRNKRRSPFGKGDWRNIKLVSHFINLISSTGLDTPGPLRNFRNEGLRNAKRV